MSCKSSLHIIFLTVALALTGCNRHTIYHHYEQTPVAGWERNDTLFFNVSPTGDDAVLHEEVEMRISNKYPFMGLCLVVEQTTFPSNVRRIDTLNCNLIDEKGNVMGKGINYMQYNYHLTDLSLNEGDSLSIAIRHNMKREILPGVIDVGIKLIKY